MESAKRGQPSKRRATLAGTWRVEILAADSLCGDPPAPEPTVLFCLSLKVCFLCVTCIGMAKRLDVSDLFSSLYNHA